MAIIDDLIQIYATNPADNVAADPYFVKLCEDNDGDNIFHATRNRIERVKRELEVAGELRTYRCQAQLALELYHQLVGSENQEDVIFLRIVRIAYLPKWTDKQKIYFDDACTTIATKLDYFLSFTQRNPVKGGNSVNSYHRHLIQSIGLPDPKDSAKNELAKMLDVVLRTSRYQLRGFFFPEHEDDSTEVKKKLTDAMDKSLVFIQLVQNEMFRKSYQPDENYCFIEYSQAVGKNKGMILLFADGEHPADLITKVAVRFELLDWYKRIGGDDCLDLGPTRVAEEAINIKPNLEKLKEKLIEKVNDTRVALWEGVPGDLD
ncbi:MAG TPA: hypothetical protein VEW46_00880 [Pyrinomonadaceae bacterium]|nr:hypothetical protein [Pyrinomonadaceae bacterium]